MNNTITASEVRHQFPRIVKRVQRGETLVAISRSRPVFQIVPLDYQSMGTDWLGRVTASGGDAPSMKEIASIVHRIRRGT